MTGIDCLQQCGHNNFEVVAPHRNFSSFMIVTGREDNSLRAFSRSHAFVYYAVVVKKKMPSTFYMEKVMAPPLLVFVGVVYLQLWGSERNAFTDEAITCTSFKGTCSRRTH